MRFQIPAAAGLDPAPPAREDTMREGTGADRSSPSPPRHPGTAGKGAPAENRGSGHRFPGWYEIQISPASIARKNGPGNRPGPHFCRFSPVSSYRTWWFQALSAGVQKSPISGRAPSVPTPGSRPYPVLWAPDKTPRQCHWPPPSDSTVLPVRGRLGFPPVGMERIHQNTRVGTIHRLQDRACCIFQMMAQVTNSRLTVISYWAALLPDPTDPHSGIS